MRRAIRRGELSGKKRGRSYRITPAALARFRRRSANGASAPTQALGPMPTPLTSLFGRDGDIAAVCDLLRGEGATPPRLVTLAGPGGVGKTSLAMAVAAALRDHFAGGVAFVDLAPLTNLELVIPAIARAVGVREQRDALLDRMRSALQECHLLLILDNFEHLLPAAPMVVELLGACPGLTALVTSRAPLRVGGEHVFSVAPLALPPEGRGTRDEGRDSSQLLDFPAVALFVARARAVEPAFTPTDADAPMVAALCRRLDGLPLAIELAAPRVRHLPLPTLLAQLDGKAASSALPLLTGGRRDHPPRLRSLRDAIAWSFDLLSPEEQRLCRRLAVFVGGFTLDAADAVWGERARDGEGERTKKLLSPSPPHRLSPLDLVAALVDQSLVRSAGVVGGEARYTMLETIREFGLEQLELAGEATEARRRHAMWCLDLAEVAARGFSGDEAILVWLQRELDNLRAALAWAFDEGEAELALRFAAALAHSWSLTGRLPEWLSYLERAAAMQPRQPVAPEVRAVALDWLGSLAPNQGKYELATTALREAQGLYRRLGNRLEEARVLLKIGAIAKNQGDHGSATARYEEALAIARDVNDTQLVAILIVNLSHTAYMRKDYERAERLADEGLAAARSCGEPITCALALNGVAEVACFRGELRRAATALRESVTTVLPKRRWVAVADALVGLAGLATAAGRNELAARLLGATAALCEEVGMQLVFHHAHHVWASDTARAALGKEAFTRHWEKGRRLTLAFVVTKALAELDPALVEAGTESVKTTLTRREMDILRLLTDGLGDREIGERLSISKHTVSNHVANIRTKLGVGGRAAAIAAAVRQGLI